MAHGVIWPSVVSPNSPPPHAGFSKTSAGMFKHLTLRRLFAVIDLETTGTNPQTERIVELSVLKIAEDGGRDHWTQRINPGISIPAEASAVHGIADIDVADKP